MMLHKNKVFWAYVSTLLLIVSCRKDEMMSPTINNDQVVVDGTNPVVKLSSNAMLLKDAKTLLNGRITVYQWSLLSGPHTIQFVTPSAASCEVKGVTSGNYKFQLYVKDASGDSGSDTISCSVSVEGSEFDLHTNSYEMHYMGNDQTDYSDNTAPELDACTWTVGGIPFMVRGAFRFDMSSLPADQPVKSAYLSLYSNHQPLNGDLVHANSGGNNAFYIERIDSTWEPSTATWFNQPGVDTTNRVLIPQTDQPYLDVTNVDVTAMVNTMISTGNYGFKLQLQNEIIDNSRIFYSHECVDSTKHPLLTVNY